MPGKGFLKFLQKVARSYLCLPYRPIGAVNKFGDVSRIAASQLICHCSLKARSLATLTGERSGELQNWSELVPKRKNIPESECLNYDENEFARLFRACDIDMLHIVNMDLSDEFVTSFHRMVVANRIHIAQFNFGICYFSCDPSRFCRLMEAVQLKELCIMSSKEADERFCSQLIASPPATKLNRLAVGFSSKVSDDFLLSSRHSWLAVKDTTVSAKAIRTVILDWMNGHRSFDYMGLSTSCRLQADVILENMEFRQVDQCTVMLSSKFGEKMALTIEENTFVMFNRNAEKIMCEIES